MYIVYKRTSPSNHNYIGYTEHTLMERWVHCVDELLKRNSKTPLANAIRKYGKDTWTHEVLFETEDKQEALDAEMVYISLLGYYNLAKGGIGGNTGRNNDPEKIKRQIKSIKEHYKGLSKKEKQRRTDKSLLTRIENGTLGNNAPKYGDEHGQWDGYWYVFNQRYSTLIEAARITGHNQSTILDWCVRRVDHVHRKTAYFKEGTTPRQNGCYKSND